MYSQSFPLERGHIFQEQSMSVELAPDGKPKGDRVWSDGCYDMVHFGHANQLRQAKQFGSYLVVGVHTDAEIASAKGPPLFTQEERYRMVKGIKWVDEVVEGAPYCTSVETLDKYKCDFCIHGDDITVANGVDTYQEVKNANRYREVRRTQGVSTTDLVGRLLLLTRNHHEKEENMETHRDRTRSLSTDKTVSRLDVRVSRYVASSKTILEFAMGKESKPEDKVIYVAGSFDLFHVGHLAFLEEAAKQGDYLIVGIHSDQAVNEYKGNNFPIMSLHERILTVLAYRPVNEVVIGAPFVLTDEVIEQYKISVVCNGINVPARDYDGPDPFAVAKRRGIYKEIDSRCSMTTENVIERIVNHRTAFMDRNREKIAREQALATAVRVSGSTMNVINLPQ